MPSGISTLNQLVAYASRTYYQKDYMTCCTAVRDRVLLRCFPHLPFERALEW